MTLELLCALLCPIYLCGAVQVACSEFSLAVISCLLLEIILMSAVRVNQREKSQARKPNQLAEDADGLRTAEVQQSWVITLCGFIISTHGHLTQFCNKSID